MKNTYKIDFATNTITLTKAFEESAANPKSTEYKMLLRLRADFPTMNIIRKSRRSPKTANPNRNLTYANMEKYMSVFKNAAELREQFEIVKTMSKGQPSAYNYVKGWFVSQFPDYKALPDFTSGKLNVSVLTAEQWKKSNEQAA